MRRLFRVALTLLLSAHVSGCVGFVFLSPGEELHVSPTISDFDAPSGYAYKKGDYIEAFGTPESESANSLTIVTNEYQWCGLTVFIMLPIPLMAPVCDEKVRLSLDNQLVLDQSETNVEASYLICSPLIWPFSWHSHKNNNGLCEWSYPWDRI